MTTAYISFMDKDKLLTVLEEGLKLNRIDQEQYTRALDLFTLIYEKCEASESGPEHAKLCTLINTATAYKPEKGMSSESSAEVIAAETKALQDFLTAHPVLQTSPEQLEKEWENLNTSLQTHLHPYSLIDQELYREYYDV